MSVNTNNHQLHRRTCRLNGDMFCGINGVEWRDGCRKCGSYRGHRGQWTRPSVDHRVDRKQTTSSERKPKVVSYLHVGEGGQADLENHLRGNSRYVLQIFQEENLPNIHMTDMLKGLDENGTMVDYKDELHVCMETCPHLCDGHLRPNEVIIFEGIERSGKLVNRKKYKGRLVLRPKKKPVLRPLSEVLSDWSTSSDSDQEANSPSESPGIATGGSTLDDIYDDPSLELQNQMNSLDLNMGHSNSPDSSTSTTTPSYFSTPPNLPTMYNKLFARTRLRHEGNAFAVNCWDFSTASPSIFPRPGDCRTACRQPITQTTDGIRTVHGYVSGVHAFHFNWPIHQRGTHASVGVVTEEAPLYHTDGYVSLIGNNSLSWGWDLGKKSSWYCKREVYAFPYRRSKDPKWKVPDRFVMVLDCENGTLSFGSSTEWFGVAHKGLKGQVLYPAISTVWANGEVELRHMTSMYPSSTDSDQIVKPSVVSKPYP